MADDPIQFLGAPGSPYTRKMLATCRYRRLPHRMIWGGHNWGTADKDFPPPKVKLLPTFYFEDANGNLEAVVDSTPITRRLEKEFEGRSVIPTDPALAFLNYLIEDYGDEWLTKPMFHYRWYYTADIENAGPFLVFWSDPTMPEDNAKKAIDFVSQRQVDRIYVVGSNDTTAPTIESSYVRLLKILDRLITEQGYVLGARPSSADFAIYGQLTQLGIVDPTPAAVMHETSPRVRAWIDRVDDLCGLDVSENDWLSVDDAVISLEPLLAEIGHVYVPFLLANAKAVKEGAESFETEIDGRPWTQPTFPYQAKCMGWIRDEFGALPDDAKTKLMPVLEKTGIARLLA